MLHAAALLIALAAGLASGLWRSSAQRASFGWPRVTLAIFVMVAAMFAAQSAFPALLDLLARDSSILDRGELWRAVTALFVQDGGIQGVLFNLTVLLLLGVVAEMRLGPVRWLTVYFGGGVISEFLALAWQPHGAGNSVACFALAGAMTVHGASRKASPVQLFICMVGLGAGAALLPMRDIHGLAYWTGAVIEAVLLARSGGRRPADSPSG